MSLRAAFRVRPVYLLVVERVLANLSLEEIEEIGRGIDKLVQQRDAIVAQLYRTMLFLASLMILIFLIEINLVAIPSTVWGVQLTLENSPPTIQEDRVNNQDIFIFGFLLIGNIIALLFSGAMVKGFMLEFLLKAYCWLKAEGPCRYVGGLTCRFYAFVFELISEQECVGVSTLITRIAKIVHIIMVVVLPLTFIFLYCSVLLVALVKFWSGPPTSAKLLGASLEVWYFWSLVFFNTLTLSVYAFAFFPCLVPAMPRQRLQQLVEQRATQLWELAGKPAGKYKKIDQVAERQIKLSLHLQE
jgi:hypothetical protein